MRENTTLGRWLWKNDGDKWEQFDAALTKQFEQIFKHNHDKDIITTYFGGYRPLPTLPAGFPESTEVTTLKFTKGNPWSLSFYAQKDELLKTVELQREEYVNPPLKRLEVDRARGVPSIPHFPSPFVLARHSYKDDFYTLKELEICALSAKIREKPDWETKAKDPTILPKWRKESKVAPEIFDYVIDELEYYASLKDGPIEVSVFDGIWQADNLISGELREALLKEVSKLENVPDSAKDWHPGSNGQVLDLVHPSLYCRVAEETYETEFPAHPPFKYIGAGVTSPPFVSQSEYIGNSTLSFSTKYQWLPSEFGVDELGKVTILSYINNLHPGKNSALYHVIAKIFEEFVPMFEKTLTDLWEPRPRRYTVNAYKLYQTFKNYKAQKKGLPTRDSDPDEYGSSEDEEVWDEYHRTRKVIFPPLGKFSPPPPKTRTVNLRGRQLQVIVKLANIILTPENPFYKGGTWHIEGMENERIVSSGIYYYDSENIRGSRLAFRTAVHAPSYDQDDHKGVKAVYGLQDKGTLNQDLGSVITKSGRAICFPNLYQHRVSQFELSDKSKPGHRKILVFFLVDPGLHVQSTLYVPPQQYEWRKEVLQKCPPFTKLPSFLVDYIIELSAPMTHAQALQHRINLMHERSQFVIDHNNEIFEREFSLCEH